MGSLFVCCHTCVTNRSVSQSIVGCLFAGTRSATDSGGLSAPHLTFVSFANPTPESLSSPSPGLPAPLSQATWSRLRSSLAATRRQRPSRPPSRFQQRARHSHANSGSLASRRASASGTCSASAYVTRLLLTVKPIGLESALVAVLTVCLLLVAVHVRAHWWQCERRQVRHHVLDWERHCTLWVRL